MAKDCEHRQNVRKTWRRNLETTSCGEQKDEARSSTGVRSERNADKTLGKWRLRTLLLIVVLGSILGIGPVARRDRYTDEHYEVDGSQPVQREVDDSGCKTWHGRGGDLSREAWSIRILVVVVRRNTGVRRELTTGFVDAMLVGVTSRCRFGCRRKLGRRQQYEVEDALEAADVAIELSGAQIRKGAPW